MSAGAFALANLVMWTVLLIGFGIAQRRGLKSYTTLNRGVRYRRLTTRAALKRIQKTKGPSL